MIGEKPWKPEAILRLFLGLIASLCAAQLVAYFFIGDGSKVSQDQQIFVSMVLTAVFFDGGALIWVAVLLRESQLTWREAFGFSGGQWSRALPWGVVTVLLFLPAGLLLQSLVNYLLPNPEPQAVVLAMQQSDHSLVKTIFMGAFAVLLAPLVEEILFRGILYPTIKQLGHPRAALWGTSLLFGLIHFNLGAFASLVLFSAVLIWLYEKTGTLWSTITAHSLFNLANFILLLLTGNTS